MVLLCLFSVANNDQAEAFLRRNDPPKNKKKKNEKNTDKAKQNRIVNGAKAESDEFPYYGKSELIRFPL